MYENETSSFGNWSLQSCSRPVMPPMGCMWAVYVSFICTHNWSPFFLICFDSTQVLDSGRQFHAHHSFLPASSRLEVKFPSCNVLTKDNIIDARWWAHLGCQGQLNWHHRRFKWTRPFRRKAKYGFCACAITFQLHSTYFQPNVFHVDARVQVIILI
jgi:hypothetical protein